MTNDDATRADTEALAQRVEELEALVQRLTRAVPSALLDRADSGTPGAPPPTDRTSTSGAVADSPSGGPDAVSPDPSGPSTVDRRRLLGRAGTAAVGAVLGGTAMSIATASPAAAATGSFDSAVQDTPALTAINTDGGLALRATSTGGDSGTAPAVQIESSNGPALEITASHFGGAVFVNQTGPGIISVGVEALEFGIALYGKAEFAGVLGESDTPGGYGIAGETTNGIAAVGGQGRGASWGGVFDSEDGVGVVATGGRAQLSLAAVGAQSMAPPRSTTTAHEAGEIYLDDTQSLWLCTAAGTPGTWVRITGAGTAGPLSMLPAPVRVYDTRPGAAPTGVGP
jgi:hypothetical protein